MRRPQRIESTQRDIWEYIYVYDSGNVTIGDWVEDVDGKWAWHPHSFSKDTFEALNIAINIATDLTV